MAGESRPPPRREVVLGVTGHRVLADPRRLERAVDLALHRIRTSFPGRPLRLLSALAEGADQLVE